MKLYLNNDPIRLWDVILDGQKPLKAKVYNIDIISNISQWAQEQKDENHKNKKAMTILLSSMPRDEGGKV